MVAAGQFLERPTLIPVAKNQVMEGLAHRGTRRPSLLVLPPLPSEGSMDHVVGAELAWAAAHAGFPTLRFNWRGVGASQGTRGSWQQDARAALQLVRANASAEVLVVSLGGSAGTALALHPEVSGVCLVSPTEIEEWSPDVWVIVAQADLPSLPKVATERLTVIPGADRTFQKNLNLVGKGVVECLNALETLE